jgi:hypothetical protein
MSLPPLTEWELDELIRRSPPDLLGYVKRLLEEVRELRDSQAEREFYHSQECER